MSSSRKKPQVIDSLETVAKNLLDYVNADEYQDEIIEAFCQCVEQYKEPLNYFFTGRIYSLYRLRGHELTIANQRLLSANITKLEMLEIIADIFKTGGWKSTSANTTLMNKFLDRIIDIHGYKPGTIELSSLKRLNELFVEKLKIKIKEDIFFAAGKKARVEEVEALKEDAPVSVILPQIEEAEEPPVVKSYAMPGIGQLKDNEELSNVSRFLKEMFEKRLSKDEGEVSEAENSAEKKDEVVEELSESVVKKEPLIQKSVKKENPDLAGFKETLLLALSKKPKAILSSEKSPMEEPTGDVAKKGKSIAESVKIAVVKQDDSAIKREASSKPVSKPQATSSAMPTLAEEFLKIFPENQKDSLKSYAAAANRMQVLFKPRLPEVGVATKKEDEKTVQLKA